MTYFLKKKRQWMVVESSKAARLIVVLLDISHTNASMDAIQKDLPPQSSALYLQTRKPKLKFLSRLQVMGSSDGKFCTMSLLP